MSVGHRGMSLADRRVAAAEYESLLWRELFRGRRRHELFAAENNVTPHIIAQMSREISLKDALTVWNCIAFSGASAPMLYTRTRRRRERSGALAECFIVG